MLSSWVQVFSSIDGPSIVKIIVWAVLGLMAVVSYVLDMRRDRKLQSKTDQIAANTDVAAKELTHDSGQSLKDQVDKVLKLVEDAAVKASAAKETADSVEQREIELEKIMVELKKEFHRFILHEVRNSLNSSNLAREAEKFIQESEERDRREAMEKKQSEGHP